MPTLTIVFDACAIIHGMHGLFHSGQPSVKEDRAAQALSHAFNQHKIFFTNETWDEVDHVVRNLDDSPVRQDQRVAFLLDLGEKSTWGQPGYVVRPCRDRGDNKILAAMAGARTKTDIDDDLGKKIIIAVTLDNTLLRMKNVEGCPIITPDDYCQTIALGTLPALIDQQDIVGKQRESRSRDRTNTVRQPVCLVRC